MKYTVSENTQATLSRDGYAYMNQILIFVLKLKRTATDFPQPRSPMMRHPPMAGSITQSISASLSSSWPAICVKGNGGLRAVANRPSATACVLVSCVRRANLETVHTRGMEEDAFCTHAMLQARACT